MSKPIASGFLVMGVDGTVYGAGPKRGNKGLALFTTAGQAKAAVTRFYPGGLVFLAAVHLVRLVDWVD